MWIVCSSLTYINKHVVKHQYILYTNPKLPWNFKSTTPAPSPQPQEALASGSLGASRPSFGIAPASYPAWLGRISSFTLPEWEHFPGGFSFYKKQSTLLKTHFWPNLWIQNLNPADFLLNLQLLTQHIQNLNAQQKIPGMIPASVARGR